MPKTVRCQRSWRSIECSRLQKKPTFDNVLKLIDYVHANPLRANIVSDPQLYRWSSYRHYTGRSRRRMLIVPLSIKARHPRRLEREAWYQKLFLKKYRRGDLSYDPSLTNGLVRGSRRFCKTILTELETPLRVPAFLAQAIKLQREGNLSGGSKPCCTSYASRALISGTRRQTPGKCPGMPSRSNPVSSPQALQPPILQANPVDGRFLSAVPLAKCLAAATCRHGRIQPPAINRAIRAIRPLDLPTRFG